MISIIVASYNGEKYIGETIDSIKNQTSDNWECILVDDGSTDNSPEIIRSLTKGDSRFTCFYTENHGVAQARNLAIKNARGKYILPCDCDDRLAPNAIEIFTSYWQENPDASLLVPMVRKFNARGNGEIQDRMWLGYEDMKYRCSPTNSSCFKKSDWKRVGGYRDGVMYEDWEFWIRLLYKNENVINVPWPLAQYRVRKDSRWHKAIKRHEKEFEIIKQMNPEIYSVEKTDRVIVVIPYLAKAAQGKELYLSVAGWRKHFKEDFHIVVVGDYHPVVDSGDDITFIKCPRVKWPGKGNYWAHIDHVHKFRTVYNHFPETKGFIYTCDDIYAVNDFTLADVKKLKVRTTEIQGSFGNGNAWVVDNYKTKKKLQKDNIPTMNWVCHLPVWYDWDKLFAIYSKYGCDKHSYVVENLYFNTYHANDDYAVIEGDTPNNYQLKLWDRKKSEGEIREAMKKKIWVCNSVMGWQPLLEKILSEHYGL